MKLDPRIKSLSDILTCFDIEKAKEFIGQKGYFEDYLDKYNSLEVSEYGTLTEVVDNEAPFKSDNKCHWRFFIPECLLENKKYSRPFSIIEFKGNLPKMMLSDEVIHFRDKATDAKFSVKFVGEILDGSDWFVCLGTREYSLKELLKTLNTLIKMAVGILLELRSKK